MRPPEGLVLGRPRARWQAGGVGVRLRCRSQNGPRMCGIVSTSHFQFRCTVQNCGNCFREAIDYLDFVDIKQRDPAHQDDQTAILDAELAK